MQLGVVLGLEVLVMNRASLNLSILLSSFILSLAIAPNAGAYSCRYHVPHPAQSYLDDSDAVVVGKVLAVKSGNQKGALGETVTRLSIKIVHSYKGAREGEIINLDVKYSPLTMDPQPVFNINEEYFLPIRLIASPDHYDLTTGCSGYFLVDSKSKLFIQLNK